MSKKSPNKDVKIKELEVQIKGLSTKNQELTSGWQRTQADFENFRNRTQQEKINLIQSANSELMLEIVPVLDNFERALEHKPKDLEKNTYVQGLEYVKSQLAEILKCEGLIPIEVKPGDQFDPTLHEAISTEKSDKFKGDQIIEIIENGYKFGDKVLKPAKVKVGK